MCDNVARFVSTLEHKLGQARRSMLGQQDPGGHKTAATHGRVWKSNFVANAQQQMRFALQQGNGTMIRREVDNRMAAHGQRVQRGRDVPCEDMG